MFRTNSKLENLVIIGAGPAGLSAAIYAARAGLNPLVLAGSPPRSQITYTTELENFPGTETITGVELLEKMKKQAERFGARILQEEVMSVDFAKKPFLISQQSVKAGQSWSGVSQELVKTNSTSSRPIQPIPTKSVIIATGAKAKWLRLESEKRLIGKGVSACATCDGFFFKGKTVAVVGGGDMALQEALFLTKFANKVYLIHRRDSFRAAKILQDKVFKNPKIEVIWNSMIEEVLGKEKMEGIRLKLVKTSQKSVKAGQSWSRVSQELVQTSSTSSRLIQPITTNLTNSTIKLDGLFVAIGHKPETNIFNGQLELDDKGYIITNKYMTSVAGVFAAGDCCDPYYRQVATAVGAGVASALESEKWLAK